jgi:hypothetical protein
MSGIFFNFTTMAKDEKKVKDSPELSAKREVKLVKKLEFLKKLYDKNVPIPSDDLKLLENHGYIQRKEKEKLPKKPTDQRKKIHVREGSTADEKAADELVDIMTPDDYKDEQDIVVIMNTKVYSDINDERFQYSGGQEITKADWKPKSLIYHTEEFVAWIDSINSGFQNMVPYKPFQLYCQQAADWMKDTDNFYDFETEDQRRDFSWNEMDRIKENSLYFLDKYLHVKEADLELGYMDYKAKPVHKVMAFLFDCGYNVEMGKPRQIAATTTLGGLALAKLMTRKNFFIKMIAQDKEKVEEIFDDKIKYPFHELPEWLWMEPMNDRDNLLALGQKKSKGRRGGANSKIQVVAPTVSAINGGAPPLVLIDEGGYINILGKMIKEARPTMFRQDETTGKMEMKRQIWIWGTGGEMDKKGKAYAEEYSSTIEKWQKREFEYGIIPLFFDFTTRPGITRAEFLRQKQAYTKTGPEAEESMIQFRQAYPTVIEDMFLTSSKTLVPITYINKRLEEIRSLSHEMREQWGFFEPVFDTSDPSKEHDDVPFTIIGAEFVRTEKRDPRASVQIFLHPEKGWRNRYFKGTDPIMTDNGFSEMSSTIWDALYSAPVAVVHYRDSDHKNTFLQNMLLGLYYDIENPYKKKSVPDLLEGNIGTAYSDYVEYKGFGKSFLLNSELPQHFQGGQNGTGIDNRGQRNKFIINKLYEIIVTYGDRIYLEAFWTQLRHFVCKITDSGKETWGTEDPRKYHDDVLDSTVFSYICALAFEHRPPIQAKAIEERKMDRYVLKTMPNGDLRRVKVEVKK